MASSMWDPALRATFAERVKKLNSDDERRVGQVQRQRDAGAPERQLSDVPGELKVKSKNLPLRYTPIKQLVIYVAPFPKGAPTAPELIARCAGANLEDEKQALQANFERLDRRQAGRSAAGASGVRRADLQDYGVLMARHTEHHFRQFGL